LVSFLLNDIFFYFFIEKKNSTCFLSIMWGLCICISILLSVARAVDMDLFPPPPPCPQDLQSDPWVADLVMVADHVSSEDSRFVGQTGVFTVETTCEMTLYETRMRIYSHSDRDVSVIAFRPTQQTDHGGQIHVDRRVSPCTFLESPQGNVHERFQNAFVAMENECAGTLHTLTDQTVLITGHSLGGSFSLFMAAKLYYDYHITPKGVYGFAGTFIGDETYTAHIQTPMRPVFPVWLIEVVDIRNPDNRDRTSEGYQTDDHQLFMDTTMICGFYLVPLGPDESYGLHDIKNYKKAVAHR